MKKKNSGGKLVWMQKPDLRILSKGKLFSQNFFTYYCIIFQMIAFSRAFPVRSGKIPQKPNQNETEIPLHNL